MVQQQTMKLAQDFFDDSAEEIKQQIKDNRATLEKLPDQIPGGQEEGFQMLFQELMDNYGAVEQALSEARKNVANLDTDSLMRQGEIEATDAARREARELGVDLSQVEGSGSGGLITVKDVTSLVEGAAEQAAGTARQVTDTTQQAVGRVAEQADGATGQAQDENGSGEPRATNAARRKAEELGGNFSQIES